MSKQYDALTALQTYLPAHMDAAPLADLIAAQFVIDFPNADNMKYATMVYIVPENESMEYSSLSTIRVSMNIKIYILLRSAPLATLMRNAYEYYAALVNAVNYDETLGDSFVEAAISGAEFYPAVAGLTNTAGIEVSATLAYDRLPTILPDSDVLPGEGVVPIGG